VMLAVLGAPLAAEAQRVGEIPRIGMLVTFSLEHPQARELSDAFRQGLHELALIRNFRHALGSAEQRVAWGCVLGGSARKGPTGGWVERRDDEGATPRQDPLICTRARSGISDQG
jgi:hypothetical protein